MSPHDISSILRDAGLAGADESRRLIERLDPAQPTLRMAGQILQRDPEELLDALAQAIRPTLPAAELPRLPHDPQALLQIAAHDAWDYLVLPVNFDPSGALVCVTAPDSLALAIGFLCDHTAVPFRLQLADAGPLEQYIAERYQYEGVVDAA